MNIKRYNFYDTDITGNDEYDICDQEYKELIKICCKYSSYMSLIITNRNSSLLNKIRKYQIEKNENINYEFDHYNKNSIVIRYYKICPQLCEILLNETNSINSWINGWGFTNPEDPTFYREDGTVFFTSTIHEGVYSLFVRDNENLENILSSDLWIELEKDVRFPFV